MYPAILSEDLKQQHLLGHGRVNMLQRAIRSLGCFACPDDTGYNMVGFLPVLKGRLSHSVRWC